MYDFKKPDWDHWVNQADVPLYYAVQLSCDVDPASYYSRDPDRHSSDTRPLAEKIGSRWDTAVSHIQSGRLTVRDQFVRGDYGADRTVEYISLANFRKWAESLAKPWDFPLEFPPVVPSARAVASWPWGRYETELLQKLAAAAEKFWTRYDPAQPDTASTNETVAKWLVGQGVAKRVAQIMAQILRADRLPPGPRK